MHSLLKSLKSCYDNSPNRISTHHAMALAKQVAKFDKPELIELSNANIKWVSTAATTELLIKHKMTGKQIKVAKGVSFLK